MATDALLVPILLGVAASLVTIVGGLLALRLSRQPVLVLGLTAGIVMGVALFDLMPEALALAAPVVPPRAIFGWVAAGFGAYLLFERLLGGVRGGGSWREHLAPAALTLHSLADGLGIGIGFQVSPEIGGLVAVAVLTHDLADGVNIVGLCLAAERRGAARAWLAANGAAPLLGVLAGLVIRVPGASLAPLMAAFAGAFLYIGACELLPRSRALDPRPRAAFAIVAGMAVILLIGRIAP